MRNHKHIFSNTSLILLIPGLFIVSAKRTAFGTFGGKLKDRSATDLAEVASRAAIKAASISPDNIDHVVFGTFMSACWNITKSS